MAKLIFFEGTSGSGKNTFCERTPEYFRVIGISSEIVKFPTNYTRDKIQELRYSNNRDLILEAMLFALDFGNFLNIKYKSSEGDHVFIFDMSYATSFADSNFRDTTLDDIRKINAYNREPHALFILDCPPELAMGRIRERNRLTGKEISHLENIDYLTKLRERFRQVSLEFPRAHLVDTTKSEEETIEIIKDVLRGIVL